MMSGMLCNKIVWYFVFPIEYDLFEKFLDSSLNLVFFVRWCKGSQCKEKAARWWSGSRGRQERPRWWWGGCPQASCSWVSIGTSIQQGWIPLHPSRTRPTCTISTSEWVIKCLKAMFPDALLSCNSVILVCFPYVIKKDTLPSCPCVCLSLCP